MGEEKIGDKSPHLELFAAWQKMMSEGMETFLRSPLLFATIGKGLEGSQVFREQIDKSLQAYLQALNLPSTRDIQGVLEGLRNLRVELEALKARVDQLATTTQTGKGSSPVKRQGPKRRTSDTRTGSD